MVLRRNLLILGKQISGKVFLRTLRQCIDTYSKYTFTDFLQLLNKQIESLENMSITLTKFNLHFTDLDEIKTYENKNPYGRLEGSATFQETQFQD